MTILPDQYFESGQAAWAKLLQDAKVAYFPMRDLANSREFVGGGARVFDETRTRPSTPGYGTIIVRRTVSTRTEDQYAALQFHPPHPPSKGQEETGDFGRLWHFHARVATIIEATGVEYPLSYRIRYRVSDLPQYPHGHRDVFAIVDHGLARHVHSSPNSVLTGCSAHYYIDPTTKKKKNKKPSDTIAEFARDVSAYTAAIGIKAKDSDATKYQTAVETAMAEIARSFNVYATSLTRGGRRWWSYVPIVGDVCSIVDGVKTGNTLDIVLGCGGLLLTVATAGSGAVLAMGAKEVGKEAAKAVVKEGVKAAAKEGAKMGVKEGAWMGIKAGLKSAAKVAVAAAAVAA